MPRRFNAQLELPLQLLFGIVDGVGDRLSNGLGNKAPESVDELVYRREGGE